MRVWPGVEVRVVPSLAHKATIVLAEIPAFNSTAEAPAVFVSDSATPQPGDWCGLTIWKDGITINHATFMHALRGIGSSGPGVTLNGVTTTLNYSGLFLETSGSVPVHATDCTFADNVNHGVYLSEVPGSF